MIWQSI